MFEINNDATIAAMIQSNVSTTGIGAKELTLTPPSGVSSVVNLKPKAGNMTRKVMTTRDAKKRIKPSFGKSEQGFYAIGFYGELPCDEPSL